MNRRRLLQRGKAQVLAQDQSQKIRDPEPEHPQERPEELLTQALAVEASVASASAHSDASALVPITWHCSQLLSHWFRLQEIAETRRLIATERASRAEMLQERGKAAADAEELAARCVSAPVCFVLSLCAGLEGPIAPQRASHTQREQIMGLEG